jgi:hypothetical protein
MVQFFRLLQDGNWHSLEEIAEKTRDGLDELTKHCEEASQKGFVDYDAKTARVRLGHDLMGMLLQLKAENEKKAEWERKGAGTAILPAGKAFEVQGLCVQNQTESDLKIMFTFSTKPKEIVLSKA